MPSISDYYTLPLDDWIEAFVKGWLVPTFRPFFRAVQWPVDQVLSGVDGLLQAVPFPIFLIVATGVFLRRLAVICMCSLGEPVGCPNSSCSNPVAIEYLPLITRVPGTTRGLIPSGVDRS